MKIIRVAILGALLSTAVFAQITSPGGSGGGSGTVSGLTSNCLPKASAATAITGCSSLTDDGSTITATEPFSVGSATASPIEFEGATADAFETTLGIEDPTADRTVTLPDTTGTLAADPMDIDVMYLQDEFIAGGNTCTTGIIGELGWTCSNIGSAPAGANLAPAYPAMGIFRFSTNSGATAGQGGQLSLAGTSGNASFGDMGTNTNWDVKFRFRLNGTAATTATTRVRIGLMNATGSAVLATDCICIRYDTNLGDSAWLALNRTASGAETTAAIANNTVDNTTFHMVRIRSIVAGTVRISIDGGAETCFNAAGSGGCTAATVPTAAVAPGIIIATDTAAQRDVWIDTYRSRHIKTGR